MLQTIIRVVNFSARRPWSILAAAFVLAIFTGHYAANNFRINTDINDLISSKLPWRQKEIAYNNAFHNRGDTLLAVIDAPTPERAEVAVSSLIARLKEQPGLFHQVREPGGSAFFRRNGLLFMSPEELSGTLREISNSAAMLGPVAADPSLRGVMDSVTMALRGVQFRRITLNVFERPFSSLADALDNSLRGNTANFSWRTMMGGKAASQSELRRFVEVQPVLDYSALEPGAAASEAIRKAGAGLKFAENGVRLRLTGPVAISDEEFGTLKEGVEINSIVTVLAVLLILWYALRSARIIFAVFAALAVGLAITAAFGLAVVGAFNLISVAFFVLFVGIGVDFGLQFSVAYRAERFELDSQSGAPRKNGFDRSGRLPAALRNAAANAGGRLALAALATALGFFSFMPTDYRGLSELGIIAGAGMLIAFATSITVLPALLRLLDPPAERHPLGYAWLAPADRFLERNRLAVIGLTFFTIAAGLPLLYHLRFDFNPLNLRSPKAESVSTLLDLKKNPETNGSTIEVLMPSQGQADAMGQRLARLPEVSQTMTLSSFVPTGQDAKLAQIKATADGVNSYLNPPGVKPAPTDAETVEAIAKAARALNAAAGEREGPGAAAARRLAAMLAQLQIAPQATREAAEAALVTPAKITLDGLRQSLNPEPVTLATLPDDLVRDWRTADGRWRVSVAPKGDFNNNDVLRRFARAVLAVAPDAVGEPVGIQEAGTTVVSAFIEAGFWALLTITVLLWVTLKRFTDVLLTLVPLLIAGVVTLEICVLLDFPLNFANIIALPLLLGVGVAFKIYYIMAWREGQTALLQSPLTRAVMSSAATTAVAFGSLWLSNHPGTSSMGKLLALSLACTMMAAVFFQPLLMGPPRQEAKPAARKKFPPVTRQAEEARL